MRGFIHSTILISCVLAALSTGHSQACAADVPKPVIETPEQRKARSDRAIEALERMEIFVHPPEWQVTLGIRPNQWDTAFKLLPDLEHVYSISLGPEVTDERLAVVRNFPELSKLDFTYSSHVTDAGLRHLVGLKQLKRLEMRKLNVTGKGLAFLSTLPNLEYLDVIGIPFGPDDGRHLAGLKKLKVFMAEKCKLPAGSLRYLAEAKEMIELNVCDCPDLSIDDMKEIGAMKRLEVLGLSGSNVGDAGMRHFAELTELQHFAAEQTGITDAGLMHLAGATKLLSLYIGENDLTDAGLEAAARMSKLEQLVIRRTRIEGPGLKHLVGCRELVYLNVSPLKSFTGRGLHHLAGCGRLKHLDFTSTRVDDAGLADLKRLKQIENLDLPLYSPDSDDGEKERFTDVGLKHIGELTNLRLLGFSGSGPTDAGLAELRGLTKLVTLTLGETPNIKGPGFAQLKELKELSTLRLSETGIDDESLRYLRSVPNLAAIVLPKSTTPAAAPHIQAIPKLWTVTVPKSWTSEQVDTFKKAVKIDRVQQSSL